MKSKTLNAAVGKQFWVGFTIGIVTIPFLLFFFMKSVVTAPTLDWAEMDLIEGEARPTIMENKPVIVYLWGTWNKSCLQDLKDLEAIYPELATKGIQLIAISDEQISVMDNFISKNQLKLRLAKSQKPFSSLGVKSIPVTYVIDRNGETIYAKVGTLKASGNQKWKAALESIMD